MITWIRSIVVWLKIWGKEADYKNDTQSEMLKTKGVSDEVAVGIVIDHV